ncbi:MAG: GNAT family N-acetyltransferase [Caulobacteraceae bacterium]|nr:GNAT family N-acetyltransferase [Caulobacteraceae bacterium]
MPSINVVKSIEIARTARVMQCEGLFDISADAHSVESWKVDIEFPESWNIGLIVGPSGCGKSTIARELFSDNLVSSWEWNSDKSLLDGFPQNISIKEITTLLSSVGFSSPPLWLRPFHVLSNGEQFRVNMARTLAEMPDLCVVDEFTSVVDRTVAQIGSAAIAKTVRKRNQKFVAVTCHYDVAEWLEPDWVYYPHTGEFIVGRHLRRPEINLTIRRVHPSAWGLFRKYHYLDHGLNPTAACFCAFWNEVPVAFCAVMYFPHPVKKGWRVTRVVCLPDYQGVGVGNRLLEYVCSLYRTSNKPVMITTSHPAMIQYFNRSSLWRMHRTPSLNQTHNATGTKMKGSKLKGTGSQTRLSAGFEYVGVKNEADATKFGLHFSSG